MISSNTTIFIRNLQGNDQQRHCYEYDIDKVKLLAIFHLFHREQKNNIMYRKCAQVKQIVKKKSGQLCPFAIIYGTKTGNVLNAAKEIDAIIISR